MGEICLQCGDIGDKKELIYCFKCTQSARHRYCMDALPKTKHQTIRWLCDECESSDQSEKSTTGNKSGGVDNKNSNNYSKPSYSFAGITNPGFSRADGTEQDEKGQSFAHVEPLIRSVWTGMFDMIFKNESTILHDVHAFLSSKACKQVHETAALFRPVLRLEMGPRLNVWPKSFVNGMGPTDDSIGVYFFSLLAKQEAYDRLVFEMIRDDQAMRAYVGDAELLVFPSIELPQPFWRFQGKLYLWGVFRGKQAN